MSTTEQPAQEPQQSVVVQPPVDPELVRQLAQRAAGEGVELAGPGGLPQRLTKQVLETGLEVERSEHLGYDKHEPASRDGENFRNGTRAKTVTIEVGPVELEVPRDREGSFAPKTVRKRQRRLRGVDERVLSLAVKGLTTGEISAHLADGYGAEVSTDTISTITDTVIEEMSTWQDRPGSRVYPVIFIDALVVKVRNGQVTNRPVCTAVGVTVDGERDILGLVDRARR
ncbi:Transposase, Mutator family [Actinopolyspora xinjiangensis]|uniref:Mutator family transposase n=1 Tax=Actinopolyspora xinjiangensis TaxID=405564 RepID=A0A1H0X202_9ACTN|nr:Transposase, Mutator family [Actinopolyspora xinjiangensis]